MSTKTKTLAKSLHTVTAIARVAMLHLSFGETIDDSVILALETLGYADASDPYGLAAKARATLGA